MIIPFYENLRNPAIVVKTFDRFFWFWRKQEVDIEHNNYSDIGKCEQLCVRVLTNDGNIYVTNSTLGCIIVVCESVSYHLTSIISIEFVFHQMVIVKKSRRLFSYE